MTKKIIGYYSSPWNEGNYWIYSDYSVSEPLFLDEDKEDIDITDEEILQFWGLALNSPWSGSNDIISNNFYEFENDYGFTYKREVIGYEAMTGTIYSTEENEALAKKELNELWIKIQEKYNPENESV